MELYLAETGQDSALQAMVVLPMSIEETSAHEQTNQN